MNKKNNLLPISIIISSVIIGGAIIFSNINSEKKIEKEEINSPNQETLPTANNSVGKKINISDIELEGWPSLGNVNAPVVIVEYSDFACPYCGKFNNETLPIIKENYIDSGKVLFVYKDFAVVGGDRASEAAHCAREQGKYWDYHNILFENLTSDRAKWGSTEIHISYAEKLGLDSKELIDCFNDRRYREKVSSSTLEARDFGGNGTPYFIINGTSISGAQPYSVFENIIEGFLN